MGRWPLTVARELPPPVLSDFSQVSIYPVQFKSADKKLQAEVWGRTMRKQLHLAVAKSSSDYVQKKKKKENKM